MSENQLKSTISHILNDLWPTEMGVNDGYAETLLAYSKLVYTWSEKANLVARNSVEGIVRDHVLDSIYALSHLPEAENIVDIGSGAGFPGVVVAILKSKSKIHLVESREKAGSFLREVKRRLNLVNLVIHTIRIQDCKRESFSRAESPILFVSRAFSPIEELVPAIEKIVLPIDRFVFLGGKNSSFSKSFQTSSSGLQLQERIPYHPEHEDKQLLICGLV